VITKLDNNALGYSAQEIGGLLKDIRDRVGNDPDNFVSLKKKLDEALESGASLSLSESWPLLRLAYTEGFIKLLSDRDLTTVSYNIDAPLDLESPPNGFYDAVPRLALKNEPTMIGGISVDFPIGIPASILAGNALWIEFYSRRGFGILTYKTVRTEFRRGHPFPNWVFLKEPSQIRPPVEKPICGTHGYWPEDISDVSMANSFGVPSHGPAWWQEDVSKARKAVGEGQVLIVSVVGSVNDSLAAIANDYATAAVMAAKAGAQIIEANLSCPNVQGDEVGELYHFPEKSALVAKAIKGALADAFGENAPPLFLKIGYLKEDQLAEFAKGTFNYIDGITAINTISAKIVSDDGTAAFPFNRDPGDRDTAGVSGWAIQSAAKEVISNLAKLRDSYEQECGRRLTILGVGGVITSQDYFEYKALGADGVETCTSAFINPYFALELRAEAATVPVGSSSGDSWLMNEAKELGSFIKEVFSKS
jgi:dihydroorotate dehydrogenase (NAD+) catalytic subunit